MIVVLASVLARNSQKIKNIANRKTAMEKKQFFIFAKAVTISQSYMMKTTKKNLLFRAVSQT